MDVSYLEVDCVFFFVGKWVFNSGIFKIILAKFALKIKLVPSIFLNGFKW